jgi:hypothetical protein
MNDKTFFIKKVIRCKNLKQALKREKEAEIVDVVMIDDGMDGRIINGGNAIGFNDSPPADYND